MPSCATIGCASCRRQGKARQRQPGAHRKRQARRHSKSKGKAAQDKARSVCKGKPASERARERGASERRSGLKPSARCQAAGAALARRLLLAACFAPLLPCLRLCVRLPAVSSLPLATYPCPLRSPVPLLRPLRREHARLAYEWSHSEERHLERGEKQQRRGGRQCRRAARNVHGFHATQASQAGPEDWKRPSALLHEGKLLSA